MCELAVHSCLGWGGGAADPFSRLLRALRATAGCVGGSRNPAQLPMWSPKGALLFTSAAGDSWPWPARLHSSIEQLPPSLWDAPLCLACPLVQTPLLLPPGPSRVDLRLCRVNMVLLIALPQPHTQLWTSNIRRWIQIPDFPGRGVPARAEHEGRRKNGKSREGKKEHGLSI